MYDQLVSLYLTSFESLEYVNCSVWVDPHGPNLEQVISNF